MGRDSCPDPPVLTSPGRCLGKLLSLSQWDKGVNIYPPLWAGNTALSPCPPAAVTSPWAGGALCTQTLARGGGGGRI